MQQNHYRVYPNFPSGNTLIDELATAMGTGSSWPFNGATWPFWIDNGIETVARNHGYTTFDAIENTWLWGDHFEEWKFQITLLFSIPEERIFWVPQVESL